MGYTALTHAAMSVSVFYLQCINVSLAIGGVVSPPSLSLEFWLSCRTLDWHARGHGFKTQRIHNIWCEKCWLVHMLKHGGGGWYNIVDSMVNGVGLPDLGIGWEVTCDVLWIRIPGSQEKGEECSLAPPPPA